MCRFARQEYWNVQRFDFLRTYQSRRHISQSGSVPADIAHGTHGPSLLSVLESGEGAGQSLSAACIGVEAEEGL